MTCYNAISLFQQKRYVDAANELILAIGTITSNMHELRISIDTRTCIALNLAKTIAIFACIKNLPDDDAKKIVHDELGNIAQKLPKWTAAVLMYVANQEIIGHIQSIADEIISNFYWRCAGEMYGAIWQHYAHIGVKDKAFACWGRHIKSCTALLKMSGNPEEQDQLASYIKQLQAKAPF